MTKFKDLVSNPEKNVKKKTVFTQIIDMLEGTHQKATRQPCDYKSVDYLASKGESDIFRAINEDGIIHFYLGFKGDEFD